MEVILNIGLDSTNGNIGPGTALRELDRAGFTLIEHVVLRSDTELTLVARCHVRMVNQPTFQLAKALRQDCIALYNPATDTGCLIGPRAEEWGTFDPVLFFQLDGTRLGRKASHTQAQWSAYQTSRAA